MEKSERPTLRLTGGIKPTVNRKASCKVLKGIRANRKRRPAEKKELKPTPKSSSDRLSLKKAEKAKSRRTVRSPPAKAPSSGEPPKSREKPTPRAAPEATPKVKGSAKGLLRAFW